MNFTDLLHMLLPGLIKIGFLDIRVIDILDVILVAFLIYQLYRLIRGSLAYNIFLGLLIVYLLSLLFQALDMQLISQIMGQFIGIGVLALLIVFQPEVRRFLLFVGRSSELRNQDWLRKLNFKWFEIDDDNTNSGTVLELINSLERMSQKHTGALLVFAHTSKLQFFSDSGTKLDAGLSGKLIESIFQVSSPMHDGALIIADRRIRAAGSILPVSDNPNIPSRLGLRHRAAVGITEHSDAIAIIVSEERGQISYARAGQLFQDVNSEQLEVLISEALSISMEEETPQEDESNTE
ncbi:MAG: diadenylate cyclase [Limisphaerales bacterium]